MKIWRFSTLWKFLFQSFLHHCGKFSRRTESNSFLLPLSVSFYLSSSLSYSCQSAFLHISYSIPYVGYVYVPFRFLCSDLCFSIPHWSISFVLSTIKTINDYFLFSVWKCVVLFVWYSGDWNIVIFLIFLHWFIWNFVVWFV